MIDPFQADYQQIGDTNTFRTPDRSMVVGFGPETPDEPQSEQSGRGVMAPSWEERFLAENPYPQQTESFGPVGDFINDQQFVPS